MLQRTELVTVGTMPTLFTIAKKAERQLAQNRELIAHLVRDRGIRQSAADTGLTPMMVSRYCDGSGANDARTHYILAELVADDVPVNQVK